MSGQRPASAPVPTPRSTPPLTAAFRAERGAVLAALIRQVGDFALAEDAVQDAFEAALAAWRRDGVPDRPAPG